MNEPPKIEENRNGKERVKRVLEKDNKLQQQSAVSTLSDMNSIFNAPRKFMLSSSWKGWGHFVWEKQEMDRKSQNIIFCLKENLFTLWVPVFSFFWGEKMIMMMYYRREKILNGSEIIKG